MPLEAAGRGRIAILVFIRWARHYSLLRSRRYSGDHADFRFVEWMPSGTGREETSIIGGADGYRWREESGVRKIRMGAPKGDGGYFDAVMGASLNEC